MCSPSRNSFTTGRRPNSTGVWNFINDFRQADCPTSNHVRRVGVPMAGGFHNPSYHWGATATGGYAQCCTSCVGAAGCAGWTYELGNCTRLGGDPMLACSRDLIVPLAAVIACVAGAILLLAACVKDPH